MDVNVAPSIKNTESEKIAGLVEKCVHCGFCTAACPTYNLDGNELDSPRGRIYLVKKLLEDAVDNAEISRKHLDSCLHCRSCEPACPSGVEFEQIASFGANLAEQTKPRGLLARHGRAILGEMIRSKTIGNLLRMSSNLLSPVVNKCSHLLPNSGQLPWPKPRHQRKVAIVLGCAQQGLMPLTNQALAWLLDATGFSPIAINSCCGAIRSHLLRPKAAEIDIRTTTKACSTAIDEGVEAVMLSASGCAAHLKQYRHLLTDDKLVQQADKLADTVVDPAVFLVAHLDKLQPAIRDVGKGQSIALHLPCSHTNVMLGKNSVSELLVAAGYKVRTSAHQPNCCGSAGSYSLLNPANASRLRAEMLTYLNKIGGQTIASANIGCILHLRLGGDLTIFHWTELLVPDLIFKQNLSS